MFIVRHRKIFFVLTAILLIFSIGSMVVRGFNFGIDFTGGSILEVSYDTVRPDFEVTKAKLDTLSLGAYSLRPSGEKSYTLRTKEISNDVKNKVIATLSAGTPGVAGSELKLHEDRFNTIGPTVGSELRNKAYVAIAVTILGIVLFITFAFRKVSRPVQSWKYGLATIIALVHDVLISAGVFIFLTVYIGAELDLLFITALLAILGYSVHDTIVVFDRVRENLQINHEMNNRKEPFEEVVGRSLTQTMGRSINTSLTLVIVLVALYFLGGKSTQEFALLLTIGVIVGTYSSIFIASPLLVVFEKFKKA